MNTSTLTCFSWVSVILTMSNFKHIVQFPLRKSTHDTRNRLLNKCSIMASIRSVYRSSILKYASIKKGSPSTIIKPSFQPFLSYLCQNTFEKMFQEKHMTK